jgi:hypothetical protein
MSSNNMSLTKFGIDDGPHNMDGLRLLARDGTERVEAFIGRKVMDVWVESIERRRGRQSLFRDQYNALGTHNLAAIERIVNAKIPARRRTQPPASLCRSAVHGHHGKRRGAGPEWPCTPALAAGICQAGLSRTEPSETLVLTFEQIEENRRRRPATRGTAPPTRVKQERT